MRSSHPDISSFIAELSAIPANDPLVDLDFSGKKVILIDRFPEKPWHPEMNAVWNSIIRTAASEKRESDINSLCACRNAVKWIYKDKEVISPLLLVPLNVSKAKNSAAPKLDPDLESAFVNPFLRHNLFAEDVPQFEGDLSELEDQIRQILPDSAEIVTLSAVGNFHHHRYALLREMEMLSEADSLSSLVNTILGEETDDKAEEIELSASWLTSSDIDQRAVFEEFRQKNLVVHGPPGTGKSQVLTNLIAKRLPFGGLTLVVSEKKAALEVLVKKLASNQLDRFAFIAHSQVRSAEILTQLKENWKFLEEGKSKHLNSNHISDQLHDSLQLTLNKLSLPDLIGGISYVEFKTLYKARAAEFHSDVPSVNEWQKIMPEVEQLLKTKKSAAFLSIVSQKLFLHPQPDIQLSRLSSGVEWLENEFDFPEQIAVSKLPALVARCQLVANESFKAYFGLHSKPREKKKFLTLKKKYSAVCGQLEIHRNEIALWKSAPSASTLDSLTKQIGNATGFFGKRRSRSLTETYLNDTNTDLLTAVRNYRKLLDLMEEKAAMEAAFRELDINDPEKELEAAVYVLSQLEKEDPNELNRVVNLSQETRKKLVSSAGRISELSEMSGLYLNSDPGSGLPDFPQELISFMPLLTSLPSLIYKMIGEGKTTGEINDSVLFSHWKIAVSRYPFLENYSGEQLAKQLEEILGTENEEQSSFAETIITERRSLFDRYSLLLRTAANRLTVKEKELKFALKTGKSLLVKEFAKTRSHKTIRELLQSDARLWIELLTPVWLSTPALLAQHFPMEKELFEVVVFDEASQIPLPNALGALQRSGRVLIAGDEQQMSPGSFFSGVRSSADLLHQAGFYWPSVKLTHHYRSDHPALIAFSNRHFYNNELTAFPSPETKYPIHRHFVENGTFTGRSNIPEAKKIAAFLDTVDWKKSIGITAFSLQQIDAIWNECSSLVREKITSGMEKGKVFFKAVENIQGDECDVLVISLGYAKDEEGKFAMRFGPLNQANGYKRLNVLLTRARQEMHFFTSVMSDEMNLSSNEAVNLLRLFLAEMEKDHESEEITFPFDLEAEIGNKNDLKIFPLTSGLTNSRELLVVYSVLRSRGWKVSFGD